MGRLSAGRLLKKSVTSAGVMFTPSVTARSALRLIRLLRIMRSYCSLSSS